MSSEEIETLRNDLGDARKVKQVIGSLMTLDDKTPGIEKLINLSFESERTLNEKIASVSQNLGDAREIYVQIDDSNASNLETNREFTLFPMTNEDSNKPNQEPLQLSNQQGSYGYSQNNNVQWSEDPCSYLKPIPNDAKPSTSTYEGDMIDASNSRDPDLPQTKVGMGKENLYHPNNSIEVQPNGQDYRFDNTMRPPMKTTPRRFLPYRQQKLCFGKQLSQGYDPIPVLSIPNPNSNSSSSNETTDEFGQTSVVTSSSSDFESLNKTTNPPQQTLQLNAATNHQNQHLTSNTGTLDNVPYYVPRDRTREYHNEKERNRRYRIKVACEGLRNLVPGLREKSDKATALEFTVQYLIHLKHMVGTRYDDEFIQTFTNMY